MAGVITGYHLGQSTRSSTAEFAWFWAGMCLLVLPIAGLTARRATPPALRNALLAVYGLVSFTPKLLRNPSGPLYHDEFAHWRETHDVLATGKLFRPNPTIPIITRYPGLHAATAALVHASGLTIWQAAMVLLVVCHVAMVFGVVALGQGLGLGNRAAAIGGLLYGLNPSFLYFDTQFAYESMAITFVIWTLVAFVRAIRSEPGHGRAAWSGLTLAFGAGTVVTHHLSQLTLLLVMLLVSMAVSVPWLARRQGWAAAARTAWGLTLAVGAMVAAWIALVAPATVSYLSPYLNGGLAQLTQMIQGGGGGRHLFASSLSPWWEQKSAYLVTVFALVAAAAGVLLIRARIRRGSLPRGRRRSLLAAFAVLGLIYFPSTLFILSPQGAEGARRSWAFSWIGLCLLAGLSVAVALKWAASRARQRVRTGLRAGLMGALAISLIGGTAAGADASYRFPGPFLYGSDARSITPELTGASAWFSSRLGAGNRIVTDRYTGLVFASSGLQDPAAPSAGFPVYNLYLGKPGTPIKPPYLLYELPNSHYTYLVIDRRMEYELPQLGVYFEPDEPPGQFAPRHGKPVFYGRLGKFDTIPWTIKVFQSDNFRIYRFDLPASKTSYHQPPRLRGKFMVTK